MSQHDYNLVNQDGASFRADNNSALTAIVSNNSGATEPPTTYAYQWWADTTTGILKMRNSTNTAWVSMFTITTGAPIVSIDLGNSINAAPSKAVLVDADKMAVSDSAAAFALKHVTIANLKTSISAFPATTAMLFIQAAAPPGWTKSTTHNDKALRVVTGGTGGSATGTSPFSTVFGQSATAGFTLTTNEMPGHTHTGTTGNDSPDHTHGVGNAQRSSNYASYAYPFAGNDGGYANSGGASTRHTHTFTTASTGSGAAHAHTMDIRVQYIDSIICTKD